MAKENTTENLRVQECLFTSDLMVNNVFVPLFLVCMRMPSFTSDLLCLCTQFIHQCQLLSLGDLNLTGEKFKVLRISSYRGLTYQDLTERIQIRHNDVERIIKIENLKQCRTFYLRCLLRRLGQYNF